MIIFNINDNFNAILGEVDGLNNTGNYTYKMKVTFCNFLKDKTHKKIMQFIYSAT